MTRSRTPAIAAAPALLAGLALAFAGCGSSGGSTSANGASTTASGAGTTSAPSSGGGLKPATTPKYGSPSPSAPVQSGVVQIAYRNIAINPDTLRVKAGTTVRWTNYDTVEHNVTSEGGQQRFASKNFGEGAAFEVKLIKPGVIHYLCTIHPASMNGTIVVVK
jgi:plastocyanin